METSWMVWDYPEPKESKEEKETKQEMYARYFEDNDYEKEKEKEL